MFMIIYLLFGIVETLIGLRIALRFIGANPDNPFVAAIYNWSAPFVAPFAGIFNQSATVSGPGVSTVSVFDWTALIAFIVIGLIGAIIGGVVRHRG
jgi:hypothetical protein